MRLVSDWFKRYLSDPEVVFLALLLIIGFAVIITMGDMLAPVLASVVIAYLLEGLVGKLEQRRIPRLPAVLFVFTVFMLFVTVVIFGLLPQLSQQVTQLFQQIPAMLGEGQALLMQLPERYPELISLEQVSEITTIIRQEIAEFGQTVLSMSLSSVVGVITILVYLILMPLLVFFFLKDKRLIIDWIMQFLPKNRHFADTVWHDVDRQIANYVRGKFWEIIIVWSASFVTFAFMGLQYAMLLGVLVGLSVIIPYVGAAVVTFPVILIAWFQWGWGADFIWLSVAYFVVQALDGNVLVPLLFSEVVNLHPVAIIVAILVFGGLWGFWGVFFAIPLATLVQAVMSAWPSRVATES
ncbi:MAG: AI-2E family transporter [Candidatus Sedimenticola endophacoides]|uniref:AI-2E family transporter n=1 Tax=Candidatus Sedimenticola endophacoides TaxID=2548426 RepID=A0A657PU35_9GAMM|nr:MAG: AI-2E family transporter [Candidatus Sedimenticola endophacoides]OQX38239.1 MAG: AI-2E family transporter [Candidatus Sedimenticola endophacoides]OQX38664.1 MAG: AI-2E family transporter [Candidatus Sedimenticola endophacoides]OQX45081.1 MAG: AI-2E family transporter [Candidatus Sedimenticola endophacoides]OQX49165.1 MAG: AI-2E family transporter [Candidatus Sedimenticola endophacoides]